jgi:DNA polymerase I-like protein with 3'-5' exonuclease and polymerase domains
MNEYRNKDTRLEFVGKDPNNFVFHYHHIKYLANDLKDPMIIREKQLPIMKKFKMEFLIYGIEFPLISIVADAENEGIKFDSEKWLNILAENKKKLLEVQLKMDEEIKALRDFVSVNRLYKDVDPVIALSGNKYNSIRKESFIADIINDDGTTNEINLFGEAATIAGVTNRKVYKPDKKLNIDYNSPTELVRIFGRLNQPLPIENGYATPNFKPNGLTVLPVNTYKTNSTVLEKYLIDKPDSIMTDFLLLFKEYSKLSTKITNYGYNYVSKINPITGKMHTIYRQCDADTGRFQSGGGKLEPDKFQSQNVPATMEYRSCFICEDDEELGTSDYSGAELAVMASHAQDFTLIALSKGDMHSHFATICWRAIYKFRAGKLHKSLNRFTGNMLEGLRTEWTKLVELGKTFKVTKDNPPGYRKDFKPMAFGTIYGMYSKKAGEVLNIPKEEGAIVLKVIETELPLTFKMVKEASKMASQYGCVILNNRTNSRAWFPSLLKQLKGEISKDTHFMEISSEESAARNIRIQGTQADFVKEASVVLGTYYRKRKLKAKILLWIHDEIVDKVDANLLAKNNPNIDRKLLPHKFKRGEFYTDIAEVKNDIMCTIANKYLVNLEIHADHSYNKTWIK